MQCLFGLKKRHPQIWQIYCLFKRENKDLWCVFIAINPPHGQQLPTKNMKRMGSLSVFQPPTSWDGWNFFFEFRPCWITFLLEMSSKSRQQHEATMGNPAVIQQEHARQIWNCVSQVFVGEGWFLNSALNVSVVQIHLTYGSLGKRTMKYKFIDFMFSHVFPLNMYIIPKKN